MALPFGLIAKLIKPALGLVISKDINITEPWKQESTLAKNWRPVSMAIFVTLIVISFFTDYQMSDGLLTVIGLVMAMYVGGRSYEKKGSKIIDILKKQEKEKRDS